MTSIISALNNSNTPLLPLTTFGGGYELVNAYTAYSVALRADTTCLITVYQSYDGITADDINTFVVPANTFFSEQKQLFYKYAKLTVLNTSGLNQTFISFMTRWMSVLPLPLENPTSNVIVVGGSVSLAPSSNVIGSVGFTPVLDSAQLRNMPLVVGNWYQVASVGDTIGAVWAEMGAIWDGEGLPPIGRNFQCLYAGYGTGTCYDITAPNTNNVKVNPTANQAIRTTGLGNTALLISTGGLCYGTSIINKSPTINCWVKFYVKATAPTSADSPFLIQYVENVAQYNLISHNDNWYNMPISSKLWVRATLTATDADTTDTGIDCEVSTFIGT